jgi:ferredoxin--NADP+ reductase
MRWWTPTLVSFRTTRYRGFRFTPGHYTRLGLGATGASLGDWVWRPFSLASAAHDDFLEFIAVLVPGGAFSEPLRRLREGDAIRVDKASYGFLTVDQLAPWPRALDARQRHRARTLPRHPEGSRRLAEL